MDTNTQEKQIKAPEMVANKIMRQIEEGKLKPGQKLPTQMELSKKFGVGMSSIREAVNVLEVMGYLKVTHGSGTYIRSEVPFSKTLLEKLEYDLRYSSPYELLELRELLECHSVKQAANRADVSAIDEINSAFKELSESKDKGQAFIKADLNFHLTISKAIENKATAAIIRLIFESMHKHFDLAVITQTNEYREKAILSAEQVAYHIEKGEDTFAVRSMRSHLDLTKHASGNIEAPIGSIKPWAT